MATDINYDIDAMKEGIDKCRKNIGVFEQAIDQENTTIKEYRRIIRVLEEKKVLENDNTNRCQR